MKLTMGERSYNGGAVNWDREFAWFIGQYATPLMSDGLCEPTAIVFLCRGGKNRLCRIGVTQGEADQQAGVWHWNGDLRAPTLTPSIGCDQRCGWHGAISKGEFLPERPIQEPTAQEQKT